MIGGSFDDESGRGGAGDCKACAAEGDETEGEEERVVDGSLRIGSLRGVEARWRIDGREPGAVGEKLLTGGGWEVQVGELPVEASSERVHHQDTEDRDGEQTGYAGDSVVDSGGGSGKFLIDCAHDSSGERRDTDGHPEAEDEERREEGLPIRASDTGHGEKREASGRDERADDQRRLRSVAADQASRPARKEKDQQDEWRAAAPAAVAEYPCTWIRFIGKMKKKIPSAA